MTELSGYVFSPLREGDFTLYRGPATAWRRSCLSSRKTPRPGPSNGSNTNMR